MRGIFSLILIGMMLASGHVLADPPSWAPAHGHHKNKHKHKKHHDDDYYEHGRRHSRMALPMFDSVPHVQVGCSGGQSIMGSIIGGAAGGLVGNQFGKGQGNTAAIIGGTIFGAMVGNSIANSMDDCAVQALEYAKSNTQVVWNNPDSDQGYAVMPIQTYQRNGMFCREYQTRVSVGGEISEGYGTACRQPDGSWKIMN